MTQSQMKHLKQHPEHQTMVRIGNDIIGGGPKHKAPIIAGPCAVESLEQLRAVAATLKKLGLNSLRAGAFKPRTSPYSNQGLREEGIEMLAQIKRETGLAIVTEVMSVEHIEIAIKHGMDCLQVGSRNMQNFELLKALGKTNKPILLKRGLSATVDEWLMSAEYIMAGGNTQVILCERGIRSFDTSTRNVLDLAVVALLKEKTHLPVIVDPSHATGVKELVTPCARAAAAVGADGLIVEAHPVPHESISDKDQALNLAELADLVKQVNAITAAMHPLPASKPTAVGQPHPGVKQANKDGAAA